MPRINVLLADAYFCVPEGVAQKYCVDMLRQRLDHIPPDMKVNSIAALSFGNQQRLRGYQVVWEAQAAQDLMQQAALCNVTNTVDVAKHMSIVVPTLMKNSIVYNWRLGRLMTCPEASAVSGVPLFLPDDSEVPMLIPKELFLEMTPGVARHLAGNMMHIAVVGSLACMLLMNCKPNTSKGCGDDENIEWVRQAGTTVGLAAGQLNPGAGMHGLHASLAGFPLC